MKAWIKKCQDDSETSNWISANTKDCPKCKSAIEKNGGWYANSFLYVGLIVSQQSHDLQKV